MSIIPGFSSKDKCYFIFGNNNNNYQPMSIYIYLLNGNNMKINKSKTKILMRSRNEAAAKPDTKLDGAILEAVDGYKYLGSRRTSDGVCDKETRLRQARCAFQKKKGLLTSKNIDSKVRRNLPRTYVWNVALYGSETWTIRKSE